jgi:hypothetical protein
MIRRPLFLFDMPSPIKNPALARPRARSSAERISDRREEVTGLDNVYSASFVNSPLAPNLQLRLARTTPPASIPLLLSRAGRISTGDPRVHSSHQWRCAVLSRFLRPQLSQTKISFFMLAMMTNG